MELGKYKRALKAMTKPGRLRTVVFNPDVTDTDVDFPDVEQPRMGFAEAGRAMTVTEKFKQANIAKQPKATEAAKKKFMEAEVTKPTPTAYGGKLGVKYANELQQETVEDLIKEKEHRISCFIQFF